MSNAEKTIRDILKLADVEINGSRPWDIQVHDERLYGRVLSQGSMGHGESYMDGWWDVSQLDEFFTRVLRAELDKKVRKNFGLLMHAAQAQLMNLQSRSRWSKVGEAHYDAGNDLYRAMLDKRMTYTGAYWKNVKTLDDAQEAKLDLTCRKLDLKPGMRVLDIGCGWGSFAKFAAEKYGVSVVGINNSQEQLKLGTELCKGLPIEIRYQDYREVTGTFDRIVSLGMFEHVGYKNYRIYMEVARRCLKDDGLFLLHTIGGNRSVKTTEPWIAKYIFPNSMLPSVAQIGASVEGLFVMEDWHNMSAHYDPTLMAWFANFDRAWPSLKSKYNDRFYRMWKYYLLSCAGSFRARSNQLWQIVLSPHGVPGGYTSIR